MTVAEKTPKNVGIRAMELYFPKSYVEQSQLEEFDEAGSGRYTIGLGQQQMGFCGIEEDVASISLTVVSALLENHQIRPESIGFLAVGTETLIDKSKSIKTVLMDLFGDNTDIEGVDVKNACYGGTQAMFHAIDWVYANWETERRYAIVVMADIAVYAPGPARCTGGVGSFAALIGPDALISLDKGLRAVDMRNAWDFYKPISGISSEFAVVDGQVSLKSYLSALDATYSKYRSKASALTGTEVSLSSFGAVMMHSPFCKLVQKAFGRLAYTDYLRGHSDCLDNPEKLATLKSISVEESYLDRNFVSMVVSASKSLWKSKTESNLLFNRRVGNMYTPSLYAQLFGLFHRTSSLESLRGSKILFFSYGSGAAAAMFSATIRSDSSPSVETQFEAIKRSADAAALRLEKRCLVSPEEYTAVLQSRDLFIKGHTYSDLIENGPSQRTKDTALFPGTFRLKTVDDKSRRFYERVSSR